MATKKFNFKKTFLNGNGDPIDDAQTKKPLVLSEHLAGLLLSMRSNEPQKPFFWALELKKTGVLLLDNPDEAKLREFIVSHEALTVLEKGRLLEVFEDSKPVS
jgi:hypothetical protein